MDAYTASGWRPPTQPTSTSILKPRKKQLKMPDPLATKNVTLQTISENHPLPHTQGQSRGDTNPATITADSARLRKEIAALQKQCAALEEQRNEAFEALDQVVSAPAPNAQGTAYLAQINELKGQKRILEDRCKTFSAWAEQQRLESSKYATECHQHRQTCEQLNEALSEFYAKHSKLYAQHKELEATTEALKASMAAQTKASMAAQTPPAAQVAANSPKIADEIKAAQALALEGQARAVAAEKSVQALLGVRSLVQSAPVALELCAKTRGILESAIDVLDLANQSSAHPSVQACLTKVCSALANLGDEAAGHAITAQGWLAKRDAVLRGSRACD